MVELDTGRMHASVCAKEGGQTKLCGFIQLRWGTRVVVQWERRAQGSQAKRGMTVRLMEDTETILAETNRMDHFALENEAASFLYGMSTKKSIDTSAGNDSDLATEIELAIGANGLSAVGSVRASVSPHLAVGISPSIHPISNLGLTNTLIGAWGTVNWFPGEMWHGLWLQGGVGYFGGTSTYRGLSSKQSGISFLGTIGWHPNFGSWSLGIAVGANYFQLSSNATLGFTYKTLSPTAWVDIGFML